jgi:ferredoxin
MEIFIAFAFLCFAVLTVLCWPAVLAVKALDLLWRAIFKTSLLESGSESDGYSEPAEYDERETRTRHLVCLLITKCQGCGNCNVVCSRVFGRTSAKSKGLSRSGVVATIRRHPESWMLKSCKKAVNECPNDALFIETKTEYV